MALDILGWKYESPYDFYNNKISTDAIKELLENNYSGVFIDDELIGFFCTGTAAQVPSGSTVGAYEERMVDIGLGMKPEMTGKGRGMDFFYFVMSTIRGLNGNGPLRLTVARFNQRAIHLYEKFGFVQKDQFASASSDFITMVKAKTTE